MSNKNKIFVNLIIIAIFCFLPLNSQAAGASLYLAPSSGSFSLGETFSVTVYVNSSEQAMNAVSGAITFPKNNIEVTSISKNGSIISIWVQEPSFSNSSGIVNFEGIVLNPGFVGSGGKTITINFKVKNSGGASLIFTAGSILANDGLGTNILTSMGGATFTLGEAPTVTLPPEDPSLPTATTAVPPAPRVVSNTHPDQNKWYSHNNPLFEWLISSDITGVSVVPHQKADANPGPISDGLIKTVIYQSLEDGIWYLHIKLKNDNGWGPTTHFRFQIDTQKPDHFEITETVREDLTDPIIEYLVDASDEISGIDHYEIQVDDLDSVIWEDDGSHFLQTPILKPGEHAIEIKAVDKAGNYLVKSSKVLVEPLDPPIFTSYPRELTMGEELIIKGLTYPNSQITFWVQENIYSPYSQTISSDSNGEFIFTLNEKVNNGTYQVWAQVTDERGAQSNITEKLLISVKGAKFLDIATWPKEFIIIVVLLLIIIILLIIILWQYKQKIRWHRDGVLRKSINHNCLKRVAYFLKTDFEKKNKLLNKTKSKKPLTKEEINDIIRLCKKYSGLKK